MEAGKASHLKKGATRNHGREWNLRESGQCQCRKSNRGLHLARPTPGRMDTACFRGGKQERRVLKQGVQPCSSSSFLNANPALPLFLELPMVPVRESNHSGPFLVSSRYYLHSGKNVLNRYALKDITHPQDSSPLKFFTGITQSSQLNAILHANML